MHTGKGKAAALTARPSQTRAHLGGQAGVQGLGVLPGQAQHGVDLRPGGRRREALGPLGQQAAALLPMPPTPARGTFNRHARQQARAAPAGCCGSGRERGGAAACWAAAGARSAPRPRRPAPQTPRRPWAAAPRSTGCWRRRRPSWCRSSCCGRGGGRRAAAVLAAARGGRRLVGSARQSAARLAALMCSCEAGWDARTVSTDGRKREGAAASPLSQRTRCAALETRSMRWGAGSIAMRSLAGSGIGHPPPPPPPGRSAHAAGTSQLLPQHCLQRFSPPACCTTTVLSLSLLNEWLRVTRGHGRVRCGMKRRRDQESER